MEVVLDFNDNEKLVEEVNIQAYSYGLDVLRIVGLQIIFKYSGTPDSIYDLGKFVGNKGYNIVVASR